MHAVNERHDPEAEISCTNEAFPRDSEISRNFRLIMKITKGLYIHSRRFLIVIAMSTHSVDYVISIMLDTIE